MTWESLTMKTIAAVEGSIAIAESHRSGFDTALTAPGRAPEIPETSDVYGWLIGSWELEVRRYGMDLSERHVKGEVHFAWVLEGRVVQDIWIIPRLSERTASLEKIVNSYGVTLRVWDPAIQAWRVTWINPITGRRDELVGRWSGEDIVQIGAHSDGTPIRWVFSEITPNSFRWTGEVLNPDGKTWKLEAEFLATRLA
jgi:hypothetical protein